MYYVTRWNGGLSPLIQFNSTNKARWLANFFYIDNLCPDSGPDVSARFNPAMRRPYFSCISQSPLLFFNNDDICVFVQSLGRWFFLLQK